MSYCAPWSRRSYWGDFSLKKVKIKVKAPKKDNFQGGPTGIPPYFWSGGLRNGVRRLLGLKPKHGPYLIHAGYREARTLLPYGTVAELEVLWLQAQAIVTELFADLDHELELSSDHKVETSSFRETGPKLVQLQLSSELELWKNGQHAVGTADVQTMFSNYVTDMVFYYEHGYNYIFPSLEILLHRALADKHARRTPGGRERRDGVCVGKQYIQGKIALEERFKTRLTNRSAQLSRRDAHIVSLSASSLLGMAAEATARGFDAGAVLSDLVFSSPGTDVVDVGCDMVNSEVMNSFLNVDDITATGVVSEEVLRRVYDAYAATGARMLTQRWYEPVARMCAALYTWHIQNDRHMFFRRAVLGWSKARKTPARPQREADYDEVFDERNHTTGFNRPLDARYACNGEDTCDHVQELFDRSQVKLLRDLWWFLVTGPLEYVKGGQVNERQEHYLVEASRLRMAGLHSMGLVLELCWLIAHANHHAWQVNYLFEAAMFGSILDGGMLAGKLDRHEQSQLLSQRSIRETASHEWGSI